MLCFCRLGAAGGARLQPGVGSPPCGYQDSGLCCAHIFEAILVGGLCERQLEEVGAPQVVCVCRLAPATTCCWSTHAAQEECPEVVEFV